MRIRAFLYSAFLSTALINPAFLRAQFQDATPEELKMTADPKAPGADAVYLYMEDVTDSTENVHAIYDRIKVLTEKGMELATVRMPYVPGVYTITKIEGRTIHSDGTIIPMTVKPEDLVNYKSQYYQENAVVFTLPNVEVGSIIEYRAQIKYNRSLFLTPYWDIQQKYFVHNAHYAFHMDPKHVPRYSSSSGQPFRHLMWSITPPKGPIATHDVKGTITADLVDIPPIPNDDWMPPLNTIKWQVEFYYTYAPSLTGFWEYERSSWSINTTLFIRPTDTLKKAAAALVSPGDSDEQKARKIYAAVMKLDNTDYSRVKSEAERRKNKLKEINEAEDVWKNQAGAGNSIALLYVALARAAGLPVWPMQVVDRDLGFFNTLHLDARQLDDYIAVLTVNGKEIYLDPGRRMCPFGSLYWTHENATGFRMSAAGAVIAKTPTAAYKENSIQRIADLTVDAQGNVSGVARVILHGADALYWRQLALRNDQNEVKKQFDEWMHNDLPEGVQSNFDHFLGLDDYEVNLIGFVQVSGKVGTVTGKHFILPGLFFESHAKHPFVAMEKRATPIDLHYARMEQDDVVYHLPSGYSVESAPETPDTMWPGLATLRIHSAAKENSVEVLRSFARNFAALSAESYGDLHSYYLKLAAADQQPLLLMRTSDAKTN